MLNPSLLTLTVLAECRHYLRHVPNKTQTEEKLLTQVTEALLRGGQILAPTID